MTIASRTVAVTASASRVDAIEDNTGDGLAGQSIAVLNTGSGTVWVGGPNVTTANGYPLAVNAGVTFDLSQGDELYAISDTTATLRVLEVGV